MSTRHIRNQPFCWQEKKILRLIRDNFDGIERFKMLALYQGLTWIDNDFAGKEIKYYTKTIATYTGLAKSWIPKGIRQLTELGVISINIIRQKGQFQSKIVTFTPENDTVLPNKPVTGEPINGQDINGKKVTIRTKVLKEENTVKKKEQDINFIIDLFKTVNPSYARLFQNKTERQSTERLISSIGFPNLTKLINRLPTIVNQPYAPKITTPYQLEINLGKLQLFIQQNNSSFIAF